MTPQCPVCQTAVPDDFGLIECTGCKTQLFVQMDGSVQNMAESTKTKSQVTQVSNNFSEMLVDEAMSPVETQPSYREPLPDEAVPEDSTGMSEAPIVGRHEEAAMPPPLPDPEGGLDAAEASNGNIPAPSSADVDAFFNEPESPSVNPIATAPISDMSSLANETDAQIGSLRYNILIAGIDTADIRKEFRELISDRRFLWDVEGILKSIQSGKVRMKDVSAVKAILLIHRLRSLPVHVQWEQHAVHVD